MTDQTDDNGITQDEINNRLDEIVPLIRALQILSDDTPSRKDVRISRISAAIAMAKNFIEAQARDLRIAETRIARLEKATGINSTLLGDRWTEDEQAKIFIARQKQRESETTAPSEAELREAGEVELEFHVSGETLDTYLKMFTGLDNAIEMLSTEDGRTYYTRQQFNQMESDLDTLRTCFEDMFRKFAKLPISEETPNPPLAWIHVEFRRQRTGTPIYDLVELRLHDIDGKQTIHKVTFAEMERMSKRFSAMQEERWSTEQGRFDGDDDDIPF